MMKPDRKNGTSLYRDAVYRLTKNRAAVVGFFCLIVLLVLSALAPLIAPYSFSAQDLALGASPPGPRHWLGTDILGRDLLTRVLYGGQISFLVGFSATAVSLVIGVLYGTVSGYCGGKTDAAMMRFIDIMYAFPFTIFVIILMVFFGRNIVLLFCAIGAVEWLTMARIIRGQVLTLKKQEYIEAAVAMGLSLHKIVLRHLIPNVLGPIIVYTTLTIPQVMLLEAFLSFLGLGVQPPMSSWGLLVKEGADSMEQYWWLLIFPGLALSITLFSLNFLGDGLRDALDPRTAKD
ncbi:MAG: ABC transporter permease subunit [Chitinivibrionales bacterium]|nr:ABC transporter permease subunit [Chitinivibrionales bacterium]